METPGQDERTHRGPDIREWAPGIPVGFGTSHWGPEIWDVGLCERQAVGSWVPETLMNGDSGNWR